MKYLFDSKGKHIANEVNGQLHATTGQNIGHYLPDYGFFIDIKGYYLGEIVSEDRLLKQSNYINRNLCFGSYGNYGNIGNYGNPGNKCAIAVIFGYEDIDKNKLK